VEASFAEARAETWAGAHARQSSPGDGASLSAQPDTRARPGEAVAGLLASLSIFASMIGVAYRPGRLIPPAILLALLATGVGGRHSRLAAFAIAIGGVCFVIGMALAVITSNPLY
jgi:hypothetical protein